MAAYLILFLVNSSLGFSIETVFTGVKRFKRLLGSRKKFQWRLHCRPSLWSFLTFGLTTTVLYPLTWTGIGPLPWILRAVIYSFAFPFFELLWGVLLKSFLGFVPWDYGEGRFIIKRSAHLDWVPFWIFSGFLFEAVYRGFLLARPCLGL